MRRELHAIDAMTPVALERNERLAAACHVADRKANQYDRRSAVYLSLGGVF